jgi:hypothetical protein
VHDCVEDVLGTRKVVLWCLDATKQMATSTLWRGTYYIVQVLQRIWDGHMLIQDMTLGQIS